MPILNSALSKSSELTIEPLDEFLKRLEDKGIVVYDKTTSEYKLKGVVLGKIKCPHCGSLADITLGKCSQCGAKL